MTGAPDPYEPGPAPASSDDSGPAPEATDVAIAEPEHPMLAPARSRRTTAIAVVGLVVSLVVWGWFASANARDGWWANGDHIAITPDAEGWVSAAPVSLRLDEVNPDVTVEDGTAPDGFSYLELVLSVDSTEQESWLSCPVQVLAADGRLFLAGREVPGLGDDYVSELMCGTSDPVEEPVPGSQSMLVLLPDGAEPVSVRVGSSTFPPAEFVELPVP